MTSGERHRLSEMLRGLYAQQLQQRPEQDYLRIHASLAFIESQVRTFAWYQPHLPRSGRVLDWGAKHGPDSCLMRASFGSALELHACDFTEPGQFSAFQQSAQAEYRQLSHHIQLPYEDATFDAVIGSGVLEHTAMDDESLKELYRVTKIGGTLVISYLPNRFSWEEWISRVIKKSGYHIRLYGLREVSQLLKRRGFVPVVATHQSFFWERSFPPGAATWMRRMVPFQLVGPGLFLIAKKVPAL